jgi:hypothetical protein
MKEMHPLLSSLMNVTSNAIGTIGVMAGKELFPKARAGKH